MLEIVQKTWLSLSVSVSVSILPHSYSGPGSVKGTGQDTLYRLEGKGLGFIRIDVRRNPIPVVHGAYTYTHTPMQPYNVL